MGGSTGLVFGPVPSRRLGASLGINNLVDKTCTYACVYCQAGPTCRLDLERRAHRSPAAIEAAVSRRLARATRRGEPVDYLTVVPTGEPTLDAHLGGLIDRLYWFAPPVAVVTNASLLWRDDVRAELAAADWISVKVDAATERTWRLVNRPHGRLALNGVLEGIQRFRDRFRGTFTTETMLVAGLNDSPEQVEAVARVLGHLGPDVAYLSVPIRPPAERWVVVPDATTLSAVVHTVRQHVREVRLLAEDEGNAFGADEDAEAALLATAAIHPLRTSSVESLLQAAGAAWPVVDRLVRDGHLERVDHRGHVFYRLCRPARKAVAGRESLEGTRS